MIKSKNREDDSIALIVWLIILLVKDPKGVVKKTLAKKK